MIRTNVFRTLGFLCSGYGFDPGQDLRAYILDRAKKKKKWKLMSESFLSTDAVLGMLGFLDSPVTLGVFQSLYSPEISLHSLFFPFIMFIASPTVDFHPRWQQLLFLWLSRFWVNILHPEGIARQVKQRQVFVVSLQGTHRHIKTSVNPWEQGFFYFPIIMHSYLEFKLPSWRIPCVRR